MGARKRGDAPPRGRSPARGGGASMPAPSAKYLNIFNFELGPKPCAFVNLALVDNLWFLFIFFGEIVFWFFFNSVA